jgi:acyl-coenzyme A synthetase/AMP-(fatty) acid ligase
VAFVEPAAGVAPGAVPDLDELRRLCRSQLADYKAPDAVVVVASLPLTPMMKIDKRALAADAARAASHRAHRSGAAPARASMVDSRTEEERA